MKKRPSSSIKDSRIVTLGYLWHYGSILMIFLMIFIFGADGFTFVEMLSLGIAELFVGVYRIIGTRLEYKHILVTMQIAAHIPSHKIDPRKAWTKSDKKQCITIGIVFVVLGLGFITLSVLAQSGILK